MNSASEYHWKNIQRYIYQIPNNPFLRELKEDLWNELHEQQRRWIHSQLSRLDVTQEVRTFFDGLSTASLEWISEHISDEQEMMSLYRKIEEMKALHPNQTYDDIIDGLDEYTDLELTTSSTATPSQQPNHLLHTISEDPREDDDADNNDDESQSQSYSQHDDIKSTYSTVSMRSTMSSSSTGLIPRMMESEFKPTPLKMVTSTAVCALLRDDGTSFEVDFKQFYSDYVAPPVTYYNILTKEYADEWVGHVVGCKTGSFEPKGRYHPHNVAQFFNSVTLIVSIEKKKEVNVKLFKNGKLQLTGIPSIESGGRAVWIVKKYIEDTYQINLKIEKYLGQYDIRTVMLNTCYEVGFPIHREVLYEVLVGQYNLVAMYDTEGYPGVRLHYYYNPKTIGTPHEGVCRCNPTCKGGGDNLNECRRISVAIFQSGKIIIAGGCHEMKPIEHAYAFLNNLLHESHQNIRKYITTPPRATPKKKRVSSGKTSTDIITRVLHQQLQQSATDVVPVSQTAVAQTTSTPTPPIPQKLKWIKIDKTKISNIDAYKTMVMYCTVELNRLALEQLQLQSVTQTVTASATQ